MISQYLKHLCAAVALSAMQLMALDGMVLYTTSKPFGSGDLSLKYLSSGKVITLEKGGVFGPSFSPDGKSVAYSKNSREICTILINGENKKKVTGCGGKEVSVNWVGADKLYWSQCDKNIYAVKIDGSGKKTVFKYGKNIHNAGVSQDGKRAAWTSPSWELGLGDLSTGKGWAKGGGCQGSISPNGKYYTHNQHNHTDCKIGKFDGGTLKTIHPPSGKFNAHRWSHKSNDYVLYTIEGSHAGYVHNIQTNKAAATGTKGFIWDYFPEEVNVGSDPVAIDEMRELTVHWQHNVNTVRNNLSYTVDGRRLAGQTSPAHFLIIVTAGNGHKNKRAILTLK